jgi:ribosome-associated protein
MQSNQLVEIIKQALDDAKAQNINVLDVRNLTDVTDYMVVASGTSNRQVASIAQRAVEMAKQNGVRPFGEEGTQAGEWALVDLGDVVVHVMQPTVREFYQLENFWTDHRPERKAAVASARS